MLGQSITKDAINADVKRYAGISGELNGNLKALKITPEAKSYYEKKEVSFIFERAKVDDLWSKNPGADALRIYYGAREDGTPTLVLVAAQLMRRSDGGTTAVNRISTEQEAGYQWPTGVVMQSKVDDFDIVRDNEV